MITIKEIAKQLGVSPTTVSNVLHGKVNRMAPTTRIRIEEALVKNHYYRADSKQSPTVPAVAVIFDGWGKDNVAVDPFFGEVLGSVEMELRKQGRSVIYTVQQDEEEIKKLLRAGNVEGGIIVAYRPEVCAVLHKITPKPLVFIDCGEGEYCNITLQDRQGGKSMVSYLLGIGHRKIAFFSDQKYPGAGANIQRLQGMEDALEEYGLKFHEKDYIYLPNEIHIRQEILRNFARKKAALEYTAGFFTSDMLASEGINAFSEEGIKVPEDFSVAGFDDNLYAKMTRPKLTTVRQIPAEKGREAVKLLSMMIRGEQLDVSKLELPTELIIRDSVRKI